MRNYISSLYFPFHSLQALVLVVVLLDGTIIHRRGKPCFLTCY